MSFLNTSSSSSDSSSSASDEEIPGEDKEILKALGFDAAALLGKGSYGNVFSGICNKYAFKKAKLDPDDSDSTDPAEQSNYKEVSLHGMSCAIKMLIRGMYTRSEWFNEFYSESKIMLDLDHPNVVEIYGVCKGPTYGYIIMEYLNGGDLNSFLNSLKRNKLLDEFTALKIIRQLVAGLQYLHSNSISHGDFHSANVMLTNQNNTLVCKLVDFGFSKSFDGFNNVTDVRKLSRLLRDVLDKSYFVRAEIPVELDRVLQKINSGVFTNMQQVSEHINQILPPEQPQSDERPPSDSIVKKFTNFFRKKM